MRQRLSADQLLWTVFFVVLLVGGGLWVARSWQRARSPSEHSQNTLPILEFVTFTPAPTNESNADGREIVPPTLRLTVTGSPTPEAAPTLTPVVRED